MRHDQRTSRASLQVTGHAAGPATRRLRDGRGPDTIDLVGTGSRDREDTAIPTDDKATKLADAILEKKGEDVVLLDVSELVGYADCFVIATGSSAPHLEAMTDAVVRAAVATGARPAGVEGRGGKAWVLIDCGDVLVHLFSHEARGFYDLDGLWCDAPREERSASEPPQASTGA